MMPLNNSKVQMTFEGETLEVHCTPKDVLGSIKITGNKEETIKFLRQAARFYLPLGTMYEIRSSFLSDFGRAHSAAFYTSQNLSDRIVPYKSGRVELKDEIGCYFHCRELVE